MVHSDPMGRDAARLIALAEAVAEFATTRERPALSRWANDAACAARRFEAAMVPVDRYAVGVYRREAVELLHRVHRERGQQSPPPR